MWTKSATKRKDSENTSELYHLLIKKFDLKDDSHGKFIVKEEKDSTYIEIPDQGHFTDGSPSKTDCTIDFFKKIGVKDTHITTSHPFIDYLTTTHITLNKSLSDAAVKGLQLLMDAAPKKSIGYRC